MKCSLYLPKLASTDDIHTVAKLKRLREIYYAELAKLAFYKARIPQYQAVTTSRTRLHDAPILRAPVVSKQTSAKSLAFTTAHFWNHLPCDIRLIDSFQLYKK